MNVKFTANNDENEILAKPQKATNPYSNYSLEDMQKYLNNNLAGYYAAGVKPDAQVLANGGMTTNDYNNAVKDAVIKTGGTYTNPNKENVQPATQTQLAQSIQPQTTNNANFINQSYDNIASALKAKIQQSMNNKQMEIDGLGGKYQPLKNQSEVMRNIDLKSILEQNANTGDRGGVGRQNALETQTSADNRLNTIDLQQQGEEASLKNDIANLLLEGNIQEAQYKSQQLKDLLAENIRLDDTNYNRAINADNTAYGRSQDLIQNNMSLAQLLGTINGQDTLAKRQADVSIAGQQLQNEAQEIQNKYAPQIAQGQINAQTLSNTYQGMINAQYPKEEAAKIAGILASNQSVVLGNAAQTIQNRFATEIAQNQVDAGDLENAYQKLVNAGYADAQAAVIALKAAQAKKAATPAKTTTKSSSSGYGLNW